MLGFPVPCSSWDSVDFATPARRATSVSDNPTLRRSRFRAMAIAASGAPEPPATATVRPIVLPFALTNTHVLFTQSTMRSLARTLDRDLIRAVALVCLADGLVGAAFGAVTIGAGLPRWLPVLLSLVVYAGASQLLFIGVLLADGGPVSAAIAGLLVNLRHLPFGFAVADVLRGGWLRGLVGAHLLTDEATAFTVARSDPAARRAAYWLSGVGVFASWNVGVAAGVLGGRLVGDNTHTLGLDAAFPAVLVALVLPSLRDDRAARRAVAAGSVVAVAAALVLPAGLPVLAALVGLAAVGRELSAPGSAAP